MPRPTPIALAAILLASLLASGETAPAAAQESPHGDLNLDCQQCHTTEAWKPLKQELAFSHEETGFLLQRAHATVQCLACHPSLEFAKVPTACADCHFDPHRGELGFACGECHSPAGWDNRRLMFDRHSETLFPLLGVHASIDCEACHREEPPFELQATPVDCFACHAADYNATDDPDHRAAGFSISCEQCHRFDGWEGAIGVNHDEFFPLTGGHAFLDCSECHVGGRFSGTPTDCFACHQDDYHATDDPDHVAAGFPTMCEQCHTTASWEGADFDHDAAFPLTGAHRTLDCDACHGDGVFTGTPTDCFSCHQDDYDATEDPNHAQAGFPTMCEQCHTTDTWEGADFDHDSVFALTGAHRTLDCAACHGDGVYAGTPRDCFSCHQDDYDATDDPDHRAAGFPTMCEQCHNTRDWDDADFDHDALYFPIYSGEHAGEWDACSDCHTVPNNFAVFDCTVCHERGETDDEHDDVAGYVYESTACYDCHPRGRE